MSEAATTIRRQLAPLAAAGGVDVVDVQVKGSGPRTLVRVVVDRKGGVDLGACQTLSHELSRRLDEVDPIAGRYQLEVTSPGTDRPLRDQRDFDRVEGRAVLVHRREADDRVVQVRGTVTQAAPAAVVLDSDGEALHIGYDEIVKATQALPW
ncbi:MAG: ribosome maturation factor RimP [Egibacteraceae bacterium]